MANVIVTEDGTTIVTEDGEILIQEETTPVVLHTVRTHILLAIGARLLTILTTCGYVTNIGTHVFIWRDTEKSPLQATEIPGVVYNDVTDELSPDMSSFGSEAHVLRVEFRAAATGATVETTLRDIIADLEVAMSTDRTWGSYAVDSYLGMNEASMDQIENKIGVITVPMTVLYRTEEGNPYANA
jgi:hypothetical protein